MVLITVFVLDRKLAATSSLPLISFILKYFDLSLRFHHETTNFLLQFRS